MLLLPVLQQGTLRIAAAASSGPTRCRTAVAFHRFGRSAFLHLQALYETLVVSFSFDSSQGYASSLGFSSQYTVGVAADSRTDPTSGREPTTLSGRQQKSSHSFRWSRALLSYPLPHAYVLPGKCKSENQAQRTSAHCCQ
jgi:hypothetical protein